MTSPEDIQLPRASFEVYSSMIVGFLLAHADENSITTKELAAVTGRHPVMISQNTKSMVFLGIIEEGDNRGYRLTQKGTSLALSLNWDDSEGIRSAYRNIILENSFLNNLVLTVKNRDGVTEDDLKLDIAKRAKLSRNDRRATTGTQTIIDIILASGLVYSKGDLIRPSDEIDDIIKTRNLTAHFTVEKTIPVSEPSKRIKIMPQKQQFTINININLNDLSSESSIDNIVNLLKKIQNINENEE